MASVVSSAPPARRRLIRGVRPINLSIPKSENVMKPAIILLASTLVFVAVIVANTGQELAVRVGGLKSVDLTRGPSFSVVQAASALSATSDSQAIMTAHHGLYAQLLLIILALLILVVVATLRLPTRRR
jgi:hypothetical protein